MSTIKISFKIPCPTFIENIVVYFLLRYRKKRYGFAFRRIKLITNKDVDSKPSAVVKDYGETNSAERGLVETKLTAGGFAIVSPEDYPKLAEDNWQLFKTESNKCYAVQYYGRKIIYMHRQIMVRLRSPQEKFVVDHKDRNGLNNTRGNLRLATCWQNNCNRRRKTETKTSKYKGITLVPKTKKWQAYIGYNGTTKYLGCFETEEEAARAYDEAAKIYHGEFAVLNFPDEIGEAENRRAGE